ncbi:MAG: MFS transporter [bacterium]|nr:MFS transporter [bacterium]MDT8395308.1 MFS transporter [bacterium]
MESAPPTTSVISRWWVLVLVYAAMFSFAVTLQMIPPLVPQLVARTGLTHAQAGVLMGLFTLPGVFLALPGGRVADALGPRSVGIWSLSLMAVGTLLMMPLEPFFLYTGRICGGIGAGVLVVVAPQIVARRFTGRELGRAMGLFNTAVPLGTITAFNLLGLLAERYGIPVPIIATAGLSLVALAAFTLTFADTPPPVTNRPDGMTSSPPGLGKGIWLTALVWVLFNIGVLSYFTYVIDHFIAAGIPEARARFLGSLPMILSIGVTPLAGLAIHRFGLRWSLPVTGCLISSAAVAAIGLNPGGFAVGWSIILGLGISLVPPAIFTIAGQVVPASRIGTGYGLLTTVFNVGVFLGIPLIGYTRDIFSNYVGSFVVMSMILVLGTVIGGVSNRMLS